MEGVGGELEAAVEAVVTVEGVLDGEVAVEEGLVEAAVAVGGEDSQDIGYFLPTATLSYMPGTFL